MVVYCCVVHVAIDLTGATDTQSVVLELSRKVLCSHMRRLSGIPIQGIMEFHSQGDPLTVKEDPQRSTGAEPLRSCTSM